MLPRWESRSRSPMSAPTSSAARRDARAGVQSWVAARVRASRRWPRQRVRGVAPEVVWLVMASVARAAVSRWRVEGGAAVGAVGAQQGRGDGQLERAGGVVGEDGSGGGGERVVGVGRGPDVDLDAAAEPVDVGAQHPVVGELACRRGQRARRGGLTGGPGGAGGRVQERRAVLLVGGELGGALVGGGGGGVPAASFGSLRRRRSGRRRRPGRGCRRLRRGATRTGPGLPGGRGRRRARGALRGVPCWWRPGTPRSGPAGAVPARCRRRRRAARSVPRRPGCRGRRRAAVAAARTVAT